LPTLLRAFAAFVGSAARRRRAAIGAVATAALVVVPAPRIKASPAPTLVTRATIRLPGGSSRFDYLSLDGPLHRLFISHMGEGRVVVFDTRNNRVLADLPGFDGDTGITAVASINRVYVSVTGSLLNRAIGSGEVAVLNATTLRVIARIPGGRFPDGSAYVPQLHRLFVSDEFGGQDLVINTTTDRPTGRIPLGGSAGMTVFDPTFGKVLVNVQSRRVLAVIQPATDAVTRRVALPAACVHNHGLLLDVAARLAFIACDGNARLLVLDLRDWRVTGIHTLGKDPDVLAFDATRNLLYVASESGVISVFGVSGLDVRKLWQGYVGDDAHSVAVDPRTGLLYFPIRDLDGHPVLRIMAFSPSSPMTEHDNDRPGTTENSR
jgi:DNA-binding beta-propeller fold protein YncE